MIVVCPYCNVKLKSKNAAAGKRGRCPHCRNSFEVPAVAPMSDDSKTHYEEITRKPDRINEGSIFARILSYLKSPRKIRYEKAPNKLQIRFFLVPASDLKKNAPMLAFFVIGFIIVPIVFGFSQVLSELLRGNEENVYLRAHMFFLLFFYLIVPISVYIIIIVPIFTIRCLKLETHQITIQDSFLGFKPKVKLCVPKQEVKRLEWKKTSIFEKLQRQKNEKLFLIHNKGKKEIISTYPEHDLLRIEAILEKYLTGGTIEKVQTVSDDVQKTIEEKEKKAYPIYKLLFFHIFGKKDIELASLIRYLGVNAWIGAFGLFSVIMSVVFRDKIQEMGQEIASGISIVGAVFSLFLLIGWPLNKLKKVSEATNRQLLSVGGLCIFSYSIYLMFTLVPMMKRVVESASRVSYSPGLLTFLCSYGFWLICEFGLLRTFYKTPGGKWLPRAVFVLAAIVDIYILYLVFGAGLTRFGGSA